MSRLGARALASLFARRAHLCVKEEVDGDDRAAHGNDNEDREHQQEEAVDVVELVLPRGREEEVEFNEDGPERQHAGEGHEHHGVAVPRGVRDGPWDGVHSAHASLVEVCQLV